MLMSTNISCLNYFFFYQERRKSRDDKKRDLSLLETREETRRSQLEDKNMEIADLNNKLQVSWLFRFSIRLPSVGVAE